jgi:hypothetical protein
MSESGRGIGSESGSRTDQVRLQDGSNWFQDGSKNIRCLANDSKMHLKSFRFHFVFAARLLYYVCIPPDQAQY